MGTGDLTASTLTVAKDAAEIKTQIDALNLAAVTDKIAIVPLNNGQFYIFKVERAA